LTHCRHHDLIPLDDRLEDGNRVVTYAELNALVDAAAANMQSEGIGAGDVIGIRLPDCVDYLITLLGLARAGAVMFANDRRLPSSEQRKAAEQAKVRTVIATDNAGRIGSVRLLPMGLISRPAASAFKRPSSMQITPS
jgi:acyl-CoA synthetase (AMP-forming)/AMP-acid ligase II